jgi:hypothetical protein
MKNMKKINKIIALPVLLGAFLISASYADAATISPLDLGTAGNFVILSKSGITNVPTSAIVGDIGTSPITGAAIAGLTCAEVTGTIYTVNSAGPACAVPNALLLSSAVGDMETAYTDATGRTIPDFINEGSGNIGGLTLTPGLHKWNTDVTIPTDVTISGNSNDVWIFQISGNLIASDAVIVHLIGGAQAKNIFWQVAGQATFGTTSHLEGSVLSKTAINMQTGATINGSLLAQTAVTLQGNSVTEVRPSLNSEFAAANGTISGEVTGGVSTNGTLQVTSIDTIRSTSTADGTFQNGWAYTFHITVPENETHIAMKFSDWMNTSSSSTIPVANNIRISSSQADNGGATVLITSANTYSSPTLNMIVDLDPSILGKQVLVNVETSVPVNSTNGSYTTTYGVKSI